MVKPIYKVSGEIEEVCVKFVAVVSYIILTRFLRQNNSSIIIYQNNYSNRMLLSLAQALTRISATWSLLLDSLLFNLPMLAVISTITVTLLSMVLIYLTTNNTLSL